MIFCCNSLALYIKKHVDWKKNMGEYYNHSLLIYLIKMFVFHVKQKVWLVISGLVRSNRKNST